MDELMCKDKKENLLEYASSQELCLLTFILTYDKIKRKKYCWGGFNL